ALRSLLVYDLTDTPKRPHPSCHTAYLGIEIVVHDDCRSALCKAALAQGISASALHIPVWASTLLACLARWTSHATKNQPPPTNPRPPPNPPLPLRPKRGSSLPLLVRQHANKRAVRHSTINLPDLSTMGNPLPRAHPHYIPQIPLDGLGRAGVCEVCAVCHYDSEFAGVFRVWRLASCGFEYAGTPNTNQRPPSPQRRLPRLPQTARPRTHRQPVQLAPAHPHQALPRPVRAGEYALGSPARHRYRDLAGSVRLPDGMALLALLPDFRHRRHGLGNGWRRREDARRSQRDVQFRFFLPGCFPSCVIAAL
ncbi:113_t:CDS:2, partial [Scutellospora calospora]